ncbi:MAG: O-acetyl-ADP-ribose deacetylase [Actinomycetales bacterium]|nr:O-acetyl-ADP-ribose deacetylase [Actinomycetales bacterium]
MVVEAVRGDITRQQVDAIVNAANSSLLGGGGVDGAIHRAAGPTLLEECRRLRETSLVEGLPTGQSIATGAGALPARWVIHTVGPRRWEHADGGAALLGSCHRTCLDAAIGVGARTVAVPAISCGAFGFEPAEAAPIAVAAVRDWASHQGGIDLVRFVLFDDDALDAFMRTINVP